MGLPTVEVVAGRGGLGFPPPQLHKRRVDLIIPNDLCPKITDKVGNSGEMANYFSGNSLTRMVFSPAAAKTTISHSCHELPQISQYSAVPYQGHWHMGQS